MYLLHGYLRAKLDFPSYFSFCLVFSFFPSGVGLRGLRIMHKYIGFEVIEFGVD